MPRGIAPPRPNSSARRSSAIELGRATRTAAAGPPPQPVTEALAIGTAASAASARSMNAEREQHEPHEGGNLERPVAEEQVLGRLTLAGRNQDAVAGDACRERNHRQEAP